MHAYFHDLPSLGKALSEKARKRAADSAAAIRDEEQRIAAARDAKLQAGLPAERIHKRGQRTATERLDKLVDAGSFLPLSSLYDPEDNEEGSTGVIFGLAQVSERQCVVIASDNKIYAGAWVPGQAETVFRAQDVAQRLNLPLVWLLNCSGIKLTEQERMYAGRRSGGRAFYRHGEMNLEGVPVLVGVFGTNPAGGGYHAISPTLIYAHHDANMAVGGGGIVSGMSPQGGFTVENVAALIEATRAFKEAPPGGTAVHHGATGFMREVHETEDGVIAALRRAVSGMPRYDPDLLRVAPPAEPAHPADDLYYLVPHRQRATYKIDQVIARLIDASGHLEFRPDYGPEIYTGLARVDGFPVGIIANRQGSLGKDYPGYAEGAYTGIGGKLYREGLIKMNAFVTHCGRDQVPVLWIQDTTGIDVGDVAEKAELLGLGQALIYSIEESRVPMMCLVLRKGTAASHYVMGGPQAERNNAFTIGTATTEIYVMHGETAAAAAYARRLVKEQEAGRDLQPVVDSMNELAQRYHDFSRPLHCARHGFVDEIATLPDVRRYLVAFARAAFQNPRAICPQHQMMLPRLIRG